MKKRNGIRYRDLLRIALSSLAANSLRSGLTILGVSIGVFSVVCVMTALSAIRSSFNTSLSQFGANVFQIQRDPPTLIEGPNRSWRGRPQIKPKEAYAFKELMDQENVITTIFSEDGGERAKYQDRQTNPTLRIVGTNENFLITNKYELDQGRNLSPADIEFNRPVCVIGYQVIDELFPNESPLDKEITLDNSHYLIVGTLKERGDIFGDSMDNRVLIPVTRFVQNNWFWRRSMNISIQASSLETMETTQDLAIGLFRQVRNLGPEAPNDFDLTSNESIQAAIGEIARLLQTGGFAISAIALLCSGVGIMNIMLVSVTERTREIGVRKSLGARKKSILLQFLLEAIFLSELGALIGIILGFIVGNVVAIQMNAEMIIPWLWISIAIFVCSIIGIGFGFFPALRAAKLNPVEALRYE